MKFGRPQQVISLTLSVAICVHCTGCSLFVPSMQAVSISANDPAAEIHVDGQLRGKGTVAMQLKRNKSHTVLAKVDDRAASANIGTKISGTGVLDIVGGIFFLIPFLGVLGPGFWELDQDNIVLAIPPKG